MRVRRLTKQHDMSFGFGRANLASQSEAVAQRVKTRLWLILGEWFMDTEAGIPYLTEILGNRVDLGRAEATFKEAITGTEGVLELISFSVVADTTTRKLTVSASVATIYGDISITGISI